MSLAQVVYQISTDDNFATQMRSNPEGALAARGWWLSKEESTFLLGTLQKGMHEKGSLRMLANKVNSPWIFG
jgi:hypothetical protein